MLKHFNEENFDSEILGSNNKETSSENRFAFVDFFATWCGPCQMLSPVIEELANDEELDGKVDIGKVDIDESRNLAERFGIMSVPTMILFKNGAEIKRISGFKPKDQLKEEIVSAIN